MLPDETVRRPNSPTISSSSITRKLVVAMLFFAVIGPSTTRATLAFLAARYLFRGWVEQRFGNRLAAFQEGFTQNAFNYLLTLRLIPLFPFFLVNLLSGLTPVKAGTYMAATAIGIIPGSLAYTFAGRHLSTINSLAELAAPRSYVARPTVSHARGVSKVC